MIFHLPSTASTSAAPYVEPTDPALRPDTGSAPSASLPPDDTTDPMQGISDQAIAAMEEHGPFMPQEAREVDDQLAAAATHLRIDEPSQASTGMIARVDLHSEEDDE